jgi:hypothetical protein
VSATGNYGFTYETTGDLQPDLIFNDLALLVDALVQLAVEDKDLSADPATLAADVGKVWIIASGGSGDWTGKAAGTLALCTAANVWRYITPKEGACAYVKDEDVMYVYSGSAWTTNNTIGKHLVPIVAQGMRPSVTGGCSTLAAIASAANQPDIVTLDFDATTQEYAQFSIPMPASWNEGTVTFAVVWSHAATVTNFGVVFDLQGIALSNDDAIAQNFGTAQTSTDTGGTTNDIYVSPESAAITIAGTPAAGDVVQFRLSRVTGNGSDTMAIDARVHAVLLYLTTAAENDN